ncbi:MAG: YjbH domain-containing protein [Alphaproteobacteria bacterium]|nr:YjbH domain-containing protein [Alphaproteobacteria bacterium]
MHAIGLAVVLGSGPAHALMPDPQETEIIRDTFGEVGILDMPSAHMAPDGQMAFIVGDVGEQQRYNFSFQRKSWLEGTFRYSHVVGLFSGYDDRHFYDRSLGAKIKLFDEGDVMPDVALGFRDIIGTGVYSSEYLVASKHFGPFDLTAGLGWGRLAENNTLPNPFGLVFKSFNVRSGRFAGTGGLPNFNQYFHGPKAGVFGGAIWQTPVSGLSVLTEYSSMEYKGYIYPGGVKFRSPFNVGLSYQPLESFGLTAGWFYGSTYGLTVTVHADPTTSYPSAIRIGPKVPPPVVRTDAQQQSALATLQTQRDRQSASRGGLSLNVPYAASRAKQDLLQALYSEGRGIRDIDVEGKSLVIDANVSGEPHAQCAAYAQIAAANDTSLTTVAVTDLQNPEGNVTFCSLVTARTPASAVNAVDGSIDRRKLVQALRADLAAQGLQFDALSLTPSEIWVYYENSRYDAEAEAIGRIVRVLTADVPATVEIFHIIPLHLGVPMQQVTILRSAYERTIDAQAMAADLGPALTLSPAPLHNPGLDAAGPMIYPAFDWFLDPKLAERLFDPNAPLQFNIYADAGAILQLAPGLLLGTELTGTLWTNYTYTRGAGSSLPHVRTDVLQYLQKGKYGISSLVLDYRTRLAPELFAEVRGGYLEDMYMGAGGQLLWRPEGSRFAFGADIYQVWKRDFNRLFGAQSYNVVTGHVSLYYRSPWNGMNFALHLGRYLAGDYGGTIEVTRRFSTGVEIGGWATFTNVPFSKFGEGSFDKGIIIHIPLEWALPIFSQASYDLHLASLTRDGGQRLGGDDSLFAETRRTSEGDIMDNIDDIVEP